MEDDVVREKEPSASAERLNYLLAHDIRNYLNIIQGHADLLLAEVDDSDVADRLSAIKHQTIAASALLQTVTDMTRSGASMEFDIVDVGRLLSIEIDRLQAAYPEATILADLDGGIQALADELLASVFANLLENALKHNTSTTPTVYVTAKEVDDMVVVSVEDDGPGLPDEKRDQLLGWDLPPPQSGVHIIRLLVDRYGGSISVETGRDGTTVTIELLKAQA